MADEIFSDELIEIGARTAYTASVRSKDADNNIPVSDEIIATDWYDQNAGMPLTGKGFTNHWRLIAHSVMNVTGEFITLNAPGGSVIESAIAYARNKSAEFRMKDNSPENKASSRAWAEIADLLSQQNEKD